MNLILFYFSMKESDFHDFLIDCIDHPHHGGPAMAYGRDLGLFRDRENEDGSLRARIDR